MSRSSLDASPGVGKTVELGLFGAWLLGELAWRPKGVRDQFFRLDLFFLPPIFSLSINYFASNPT